MSAKRAAAETDAQSRALTKAEACRILQVAPTADPELVTKAYWHLARKYRAYAPHDQEARDHLDEINRAFVALHPGRGEAPLAGEVPAPPYVPPPFFEQLFRLYRQALEHTRAVWPEHLGEVSVLSGTTAILTYLALAAGASALWTLLAAGIAGLVIWAPWRRAG
jgi:hypothetical protein